MLRRTRALVSIAFALSLFSAIGAAATAKRTFVASNGNDANPCSLVQPCRTFGAAITQTSAGGEVIVLDSAGYGAVTITKSVSIIAPAGIYAGISVLSGDGVTVNAGATDTVVLRGLTINGQGGANGITINNALMVHVENCVIANMGDKGIDQVAGTLDVKDTIVRDGVWGIFVQAPGQANLDHVRIEGNATGVAAEYGGKIAMQDSLVTRSSNIGVVANNPTISGSQVTISRSLISSNNYGVYVDANNGSNVAIVTISDSTITQSNVAIHVTSNGDPSYSGRARLTNNTVSGNGRGVQIVANGWTSIGNNNLLDNQGWDVTDDATCVIETLNNNLKGGASGGYFPSTVIPMTTI